MIHVFLDVVCPGSIRFILGVRLVLACWHRRTPVSRGRGWTQMIKQDDRHIKARKQNLDKFDPSIHQHILQYLNPCKSFIIWIFQKRQLSALGYGEFVSTTQRANHADCSLRTLLSLHIFCPYLRRSIYTILINSLHAVPRQAAPPKRQDFVLLHVIFALFYLFHKRIHPTLCHKSSSTPPANLKWRSSQRPWLEFFSPLLPLNVAWTTQMWLGQRLGMAMQLMIRSAISFLGLRRIRELIWIDIVFTYCFVGKDLRTVTNVGMIQRDVQV